MNTKFLPVALCLLLPLLAISQQTQAPRHAQRPLGPTPAVAAPEPPLTQARQQPLWSPALPPAGKASTVTPIPLGTTTSGTYWVRNEENILHCEDNSGMLIHIHRQDVTIWGGGSAASGKLRYDISIDDGATWSLDVGPLNPIYSKLARYPQVAGFGTSTNPLDNKIVWAAATLDTTPDWNGIVSGACDVSPVSPPVGSETYTLADSNTLIPAALCERVDGEYWMVDMQYASGFTTGALLLLKGIYNTTTGEVDWAVNNTIVPPYDLSFDGIPHGTVASMEWSPDGTVGWVSMLGDISGHHSHRPIFWKSTDGGVTWSAPMEVDMNAASAWVDDSLKTLWVDSTGAPYGTGVATTAFDHDITVDMDGNAHMAVVVGNTPGPGGEYSISSGLAMFMADVSTSDGGVTWYLSYLAPILSLRGEFGGAGGADPFTQDNEPQASRNADGSKVYFSWVDSDTNVTGFGETQNLAPNLRAMGRRMTDDTRTCYKLFTDGDPVWDSQVIRPTMARNTLRSGTVDKLFTGFVGLDLLSSSSPTTFYSLLNDTWFDDNEFLPWSVFTDLSWDGWCVFPVHRSPTLSTQEIMLHQSHPNPATDAATLTYELPQSAEVELVLCNLQGQRLQVLASGAMPAGTHKVHLDTQGLAAGMYLYTLRVGDQQMTRKLSVTR